MPSAISTLALRPEPKKTSATFLFFSFTIYDSHFLAYDDLDWTPGRQFSQMLPISYQSLTGLTRLPEGLEWRGSGKRKIIRTKK